MRTNPTRTIPSLSGTFGITTRLALNPKMPKEPSNPFHSDTRVETSNKYRDDKRTNKGQLVKAYIIKFGFGANNQVY
ncbi:MAG: hypothetical protein EA393_07300 [Bacteroidetes bacterium]|nr:MAG: hypothetical protein EA393_07300 [Bacteroidota bacterium]